jgi:hypothetical protein
MKKIIIENVEFDLEKGKRLLKLKYSDCQFPQLESEWESIEPFTFEEIAEFENLEERRVGILCLGIERLVEQVNPTLLNSETITKTNTYIDENGELVTKTFEDTYELYEVAGENLSKNLDNWRKVQDCHFIKCKDVSTEREYLIWVDIDSVYRTNKGDREWFNMERDKNKVKAIQAIAWTIQTNIEKGNIEKIVRQGDCILIKPTNSEFPTLDTPRHLTEEEYRKLMVAES